VEDSEEEVVAESVELWDEEGEEDEETEEVGSATDVGETVKNAEAEEDSDELEEMDVARALEVSIVAEDPAFLTKRFGHAIAGLAAAFASRSLRHSMWVAQRFCKPARGAASTVDTKDRSIREPLTNIIIRVFLRVSGCQNWMGR